MYHYCIVIASLGFVIVLFCIISLLYHCCIGIVSLSYHCCIGIVSLFYHYCIVSLRFLSNTCGIPYCDGTVPMFWFDAGVHFICVLSAANLLIYTDINLTYLHRVHTVQSVETNEDICYHDMQSNQGGEQDILPSLQRTTYT